MGILIREVFEGERRLDGKRVALKKHIARKPLEGVC